MPEVDELRTILESGDITGLFSSDELSECPRLSSSLVNIPTYCTHAITRHSFYFIRELFPKKDFVPFASSILEIKFRNVSIVKMSKIYPSGVKGPVLFL